eukprot:4780249-Pleurochrysis_carterae.AAC.5
MWRDGVCAVVRRTYTTRCSESNRVLRIRELCNARAGDASEFVVRATLRWPRARPYRSRSSSAPGL